MAKRGQPLGEQSDPDGCAQTYYSRGELGDAQFYFQKMNVNAKNTYFGYIMKKLLRMINKIWYLT